MTEWSDPAALADRLKAGMTVFVPGGMSEPRTLWSALRAVPEKLQGVHFVETRLPGYRSESYAELECTATTFFLTAELHDAWQEGKIRFVPMHYRDTWDHLAQSHFDLVLLQVGPPDADGLCSHGLTCDFVPAALGGASVLAAEINHALPSPPGTPKLALSEIDLAFVVDEPPPRLEMTEPTPRTAAIASHVAALIDDGACLQTGIGAIPDAVLGALGDRRDLGMHSGLISDGALDLIEAGALTGRRKSIDREHVVTGFAHGSARLYDWLRTSDSVLFRTVDYTHDPGVLSRIRGFTAINSAIEVDLYGQVNAEWLSGRQVSGTGGSVDFARGAARAPEGRSIIALPATAAGGRVSRIVPRLPVDAPLTLLRTDVEWVVTEHGAVSLRGHSLEERAERLIEIAEPEFRSELRDAWRGDRQSTPHSRPPVH